MTHPKESGLSGTISLLKVLHANETGCSVTEGKRETEKHINLLTQ
jgi:hypothetical protein